MKPLPRRIAIMITASTLAVVLALVLTGPKSPPVGEEKLGLPQYHETYGEEKTLELYRLCMEAGLERNYTGQSVHAFCSCHLYIMQDVIPLKELQELKPDARSELFREISKGCSELGIVPVPAKSRSSPVPQPPKFGTDESISI